MFSRGTLVCTFIYRPLVSLSGSPQNDTKNVVALPTNLASEPPCTNFLSLLILPLLFVTSFKMYSYIQVV